MVDWLLLQATAISLIVAIMCLVKRRALNLLGAEGLYKLWLLVPLSLVLSLLPQWSSATLGSLSYVVSLKQASATVAQPLLEVSDLILAVWALGVMVLLSTLGTAHRRYVKSLTKISEIHSPLASIEELKGIGVYTSDGLISPCIVGCFRPILVLPEDFLQRFSASQQRLILRHEMVHKQRGDLISNLLAQLVLVLFWFNPLVWKGYQVFRQTQELACDQAVLAKSTKNTRIDYAKAMLLSTQQKTGWFSTTLHYGGKDDLKERLLNIKQINAFSSWRWFSFGLSLFIAMALFHGVSADSKNMDEQVQVVSRVEPIYPLEAAELGLEGSVVLSFDIDLEGRVGNVDVVESSPSRVFDKASKIALRQWLYSKPGKPLKDVRIQLDFRLNSDSSGAEASTEAAD